MSKNVPQVGFDILELSENFVRGKIDLYDMAIICTDIQQEIYDADFEVGTVGVEEDGGEDKAVRQSNIAWLAKSKQAKKLVKYVVDQVNKQYFKRNISDKPPEYQYTLYSNPDDHYDWHQDHYDEDPPTDYRRTLSLSLCLTASDMYEGAELFVKDGDDLNIRVFKMGFGEFVIFPSEVEHRVNALRDGERSSLVIWYGYSTPQKDKK